LKGHEDNLSKIDYKNTSFKKQILDSSNNHNTTDNTLLSDNIFNKNSFLLSPERNEEILSNPLDFTIINVDKSNINENTPVFKEINKLKDIEIPKNIIKTDFQPSDSINDRQSQYQSIHSTISSQSNKSNRGRAKVKID